jgi:hypothetical protein
MTSLPRQEVARCFPVAKERVIYAIGRVYSLFLKLAFLFGLKSLFWTLASEPS